MYVKTTRVAGVHKSRTKWLHKSRSMWATGWGEGSRRVKGEDQTGTSNSPKTFTFPPQAPHRKGRKGSQPLRESLKQCHLRNPGFSQGSKYSKWLQNHTHFLPHQALVAVGVQGGHGAEQTSCKSRSGTTAGRGRTNRWSDSRDGARLCREKNKGWQMGQRRRNSWREIWCSCMLVSDGGQEPTVTYCRYKPTWTLTGPHPQKWPPVKDVF